MRSLVDRHQMQLELERLVDGKELEWFEDFDGEDITFVLYSEKELDNGDVQYQFIAEFFELEELHKYVKEMK